jgi:HSP20 family molecular chaperone IbpA
MSFRSLFDDFQPLISTSYKMLGELSKEMDTFARSELGSGRFGRSCHMVDVDVISKLDHYEVHADFPGFTKEDVNIEITDEGFLMLSAERKLEKQGDNGSYMRKYGSFVKELRLPEDSDVDQINARMVDGVLFIYVKKKEKPKANNTRRILLA